MLYYPIYLVHKFLLSVFLVSFQATAIGRITMIVVIQAGMLIYTVVCKPFKNKLQQIIMALNEALLFFAALCLYAI